MIPGALKGSVGPKILSAPEKTDDKRQSLSCAQARQVSYNFHANLIELEVCYNPLKF
jgi:hypothetical protein